MAIFGSSLIGFLIAVAILVTIHELGHYLAARWCGVRVVRFSVGFGPVLLRWTGRRSIFRGTEFAVSAIPLGGYVRMVDTRDPEFSAISGDAAAGAFNRQRLWRRSVIVAAGPLANFVLAALLYAFALAAPDRDLSAIVAKPDNGTPAYVAGLQGGDRIVRIDGRNTAHWGDVRWELLSHLFSEELNVVAERGGIERTLVLLRKDAAHGEQASPENVGARLAGWGLNFDQPAIIGTVRAGGRGEIAGLLSGDRIVAVNEQPVRQWSQFTRVIQSSVEKRTPLEIDRRGMRLRIDVTPRAEVVNGRPVGRLDVTAISPAQLGEGWIVERERSVSDALVAAMQRTTDATVLTVRVLWAMLTGDISLRQISGPLTMAEGAGQTLSQGAVSFTLFLAIVSISIGVLNLLPVPMLDGGQLLYHLLEAIKGAPLSERAEALGQRVGIGFVTALTALALYNDFLRIIS